MSPAPDWRSTTIAPDGSHHLLNGGPLYRVRFDEVLKFHQPGLAPVRDTSGMYHIDTSGNPPYGQRFRRTFGFYDGLAAVDDGASWYHIRPGGEPAYAGRWSWCGNFQGARCAVRAAGDRYLHIDPAGGPVYAARWRYTGDYRDGIAVVQRDDGRSTHVDTSGAVIHDRWFVDLDVFHKAFARARDEAGWMHVDAVGKPIYERRFAAVEPFYNGQARVERFDGGLEVIDEAGRALVELRAAKRSGLQSVSAELVSFWRCETVFTAVRLGLFDRLPIAVGERESGTDRLLGALGELGMVEIVDGGWRATASGAVLQSGHPHSLAAAASYWSGQARGTWSQLDAVVRDPAWRATDPFSAAARDPAEGRALHAALAPYARHDYAGFPAALDPGHRVLVDAGGGSGALAQAVLGAVPTMVATVLDRPEVASAGDVPEGLESGLRFVGGDLFSAWPVTGDAIVLARVLHDWPDELAVAILRQARASLDPGGRVYIVELVRPPTGFTGALLSLHMLVTTGGQERTLVEFEGLFGLAGLRLREVRSIGAVSQVLVVEAM